MTMFPRVGEKRRIDDIGIEDEEAIGSLCRLGGRPVSPKSAMEQEKRIRREIANSNERRRMQSINAGFASLKTLLPHHEGEKLSKAAILQQTAEYIYQLEQEKTRLLSQNCQLKRLVNQQQHHADNEGGSPSGGDSPCRSPSNDTPGHTNVDGGEDLRREMIDLRVQLDRERRHRLSLEEHMRTLENATYGPIVDTPLPEVTRHVNIQVPQTAIYHKTEQNEIKAEPEIKVEQQHQQSHHGHHRSSSSHHQQPTAQQSQQQSSQTSQPSGQKIPTVAPAAVAPPLPPPPQPQPPPPPQHQPTQVKPNCQMAQPLVVGQVTNVVEVKTTPRLSSCINSSAVKTEHVNAVQHTNHPHSGILSHHRPSTTVVATQPTNPAMVRQHQPPTLLTRPNTNVNSVAHHNIVSSGQVTPATTIVTVVPSPKGGMDALPSVLEALTSSGRVGAKVEVEPAPRVPSPAATIEYVEEAKSHTVYIVNSTNAACQKSLDTICEAIRHLEGDHMFQTNEEQHPHIEEEIITEETLTIEDHTGHQMSIEDQPGQHMSIEGEQESLTLHMVEPQDAPLELTTTHRTTHSEQQPTTFSPNIVSSPKTSSTSLLNSVNMGPQPTRPGVIVVKHP
ncbi:unnamed protein product [Meganyctiphanes norvegica]|uniref:BHLH domain-containing protein n=1 Tax=Meganyctiphanes norvegica TaxID=48144 RepID=A0AAV2PSX2_MEGNR